jgi:hypothetical protein
MPAVSAGSGKLYDDDGSTANAYEQGQYELLNFASKLQGRELTISVKPKRASSTSDRTAASPCRCTMSRARLP